MSKPVIDKAEVSIDFPDKFYHGSFGRSSRYDVTVDEEGVHIALDREGEDRRHVGFHLHHHLFAGILESVAEQVAAEGALSHMRRRQLTDAVAVLSKALKHRS